MSYAELIHKYERKKRISHIVIITAEALFVAAVLIVGMITKISLEGIDLPVAGKFNDLKSFIIIAALLAVIFIAADIFLFRHQKAVEDGFASIMEQTGITDKEIFAEIVSTSKHVPAAQNVFINDQYLIDLERFWGCRLDRITDVQTEVRGSINDDNTNYYVVIFHDGKRNSIHTTGSSFQKKVYNAVYEAWQRVYAVQ